MYLHAYTSQWPRGLLFTLKSRIAIVVRFAFVLYCVFSVSLSYTVLLALKRLLLPPRHHRRRPRHHHPPPPPHFRFLRFRSSIQARRIETGELRGGFSP